MKRALVVWGGLEVHEPEAGAEVVRTLLAAEDFEVTVTGDYAALGAPDVGGYDLIVPQVTAGEIDRDSAARFVAAAEAGTGVAGFHHGLATSFRNSNAIRFLASCTFVAHPGGIIRYRVDPVVPDDPVMAGIGSFEHVSEQYYLHVDPAVEVLATTTIGGHASWREGTTMPVVFKTRYGKGRVFYSALGHAARELEYPEVRTILRRGLLWAAR